MKIDPSEIKLYPMAQDFYGERTHEEYVNQMAAMILNLMIGYRIDPETLYKLALYAYENREVVEK